MKICVISDSHDQIPLLDAAVAQAKAAGAQVVLHCGDVVAPSTLHCLDRHGLPVHVIHGNNTGDLFTLARLATRPNSVIRYHGMDAALHLGGRHIFLVHYPHYARALAATGDWDLVCCGHSHRVEWEQLPNMKGGSTLVLNPGTMGGVGREPATYLMVELDSLDVELHQIASPIAPAGP